ncbi:MAG: TolC family outer membrane protein [Alphaproteobacteria bacterium]
MAALAAGPATGLAETLQDALTSAYTTNPTLDAARAQLRAVDEQVPQARANYFPTVTGTGNLGKSDTTSKSPFFTQSTTISPRGANVTISQPVYRGGRTEAQTDQAENDVLAGRAQLLVTEQTILLAAATAYADVFRDQAVLDLNINNEQVLRRQLEATTDQFQVGEVTRTDVSQAEARLASATAARIQAEGNLESSRAVYRNVIGLLPGKLTEPDPLAGLPGNRDDAIAESEKNPAVISARFSELAARSSVDVAYGQLLPTLSLNGEYQRQDEASSRNGFAESTSLTAQLSVPLYPGGGVYSQVRQAKETVLQLRKQVEAALRDAAQQSTQAWNALETARAQSKSFEAQIRANEIALEGVRQEATVGSRTVLDILNAEQELLDSKVNHVRSRRDALVAGWQLKAAVGQLTAKALDLPVEYYDVEKHYEEVREKLWGVGEDLK